MNLTSTEDEREVPLQFNFARDVVEELGAQNRDRRALTFVDSIGAIRRLTFYEIALSAARWSTLLRDQGLERGDRLLVVVGKTPDWHMVVLGALRLGAIVIPCSEQLRAKDLAFRASHSGATMLVAQRAAEAEVQAMQELLDDSPRVLYVEDVVPHLGSVQPIASADTWWDEPAFILYTSGTTNEPKGVTHTHAYTFAKRVQAEYWLDARPTDLVWCTAGTGWAKSIWNALLGPWSVGAETVLHEGPFDPGERFELIERLGVTVLCQAPTEYRMMAKLDDLALHDLSRLRRAVSAGEPLNPEVIATFRDAFGLTIYDGYGQTENTLLVANGLGAEVRPGSMGLPTPGHEVAVIDEHGEPVAPGIEGDIALRGQPPSLFAGYWNDPEATAAAFRGDWYVTGDRATCDADGYFWFTGRADDVILSAAYRIGPFEVESALLEHAAVAESAVVGKPDPLRGQVVKAFVVLRQGQEGDDELVRELQEHCKRVTAPYKYPREIEFVESLPKTRSGKIRRLELRELEERRARESGMLAPERERELPALPDTEPPEGGLDPQPVLEARPPAVPVVEFEPWPEPPSSVPAAEEPRADEVAPQAEREAGELQPSHRTEAPEEEAAAKAEHDPEAEEEPEDARSSLVARLRAYERRPGEPATIGSPFARRERRPTADDEEREEGTE